VPRSSSAKCRGSSIHDLKSRLRFASRGFDRDNLILKGRFLEDPRLDVVTKYLKKIVGAKIVRRRFRRVCDLQIGFDTIDIFGPDGFSGPCFDSSCFASRSPASARSPAQASAGRSRHR